jgi:hypothetical protein
MLQTVETSKAFDERTRLPDGREVVETTTRYEYCEKWVPNWIDSSKFNDQNKRQDNIKASVLPRTFDAPEFKIGDIKMRPDYLKTIFAKAMT